MTPTSLPHAMAIGLLGGLAAYVSHYVPLMSGREQIFSSEVITILGLWTVLAVDRLSYPEAPRTWLFRGFYSAVLLAPFAYRAVSIASSTGSGRSGLIAFFEGIYLSLPQLLVATALGLVPAVVVRIRRARTPRPAN